MNTKTAFLPDPNTARAAAALQALSAQPTGQAGEAGAAVVFAPDTTPATELENPARGGHFLRDPATGALSLNPAFHAPQPE